MLGREEAVPDGNSDSEYLYFVTSIPGKAREPLQPPDSRIKLRKYNSIRNVYRPLRLPGATGGIENLWSESS